MFKFGGLNHEKDVITNQLKTQPLPTFQESQHCPLVMTTSHVAAQTNPHTDIRCKNVVNILKLLKKQTKTIVFNLVKS